MVGCCSGYGVGKHLGPGCGQARKEKYGQGAVSLGCALSVPEARPSGASTAFALHIRSNLHRLVDWGVELALVTTDRLAQAAGSIMDTLDGVRVGF